MVEAEPTAFSSSAEDAITRSLPVTLDTRNASNLTSPEDLARLKELYEVESTANEILTNGYKQVALQFPDELLHISVPIYQSLRQQLSDRIGLYILADTSYGSCCVDEVAAQHIDADVIVHYGYSCLSRPSRLPVLYVFTKGYIDVQDATQSLLELERRGDTDTEYLTHSFILIPDVAYSHKADELRTALRDSPLCPPDSQIFYNCVPKRDGPLGSASPDTLSSHPPPNPEAIHSSTTQNPRMNSFSPRSHRRYTLPPSIAVSSCTIFYIGSEGLGLTNLLMTHPDSRIISYDPMSRAPRAKLESARTNRLLMRRYAVVQRARDADVIGILVGTLGVVSYLPLLSHIRALLRSHHKKSYTLSVGKLSPSKLANFAEIDCFVMVACPENSVIDSKEFLRPIVTPFELSLALRTEPSWPGNYILDFEHVIEHQIRGQEIESNAAEDDDRDPDQPVFSLVTGKYRHAKRYGEAQDDLHANRSTDPSSIILRNADNALTRLSDSAGAEFLHQRTFKGLEQRLGEDAPSALEQGRSGIARGYQDDHPQAKTETDGDGAG